MIEWLGNLPTKSPQLRSLLYLGLLFPIVLVGQNQAPVIETPFSDLMMDQGGAAMELDLTDFMNDPDVDSPAVRLNVTINGGSRQINFALFRDAAPRTANNFIAYINAGRFDDNIIHRSVPGFIIQGGGFRFNGNLIEDVPNFPAVQNEPGISNTRGTVAMAKLGGDPNSATSGWFINLANNATLLDDQNGGFTVFARVLGNGMSVADEIASLEVFDAANNLGGAFGELPLSAFSLARSSFVETNASLIEPLTFSANSSDPNIVSLSLSQAGELKLTPSQLNSGVVTIAVTATDLEGRQTESGFKVTVISDVETYETWQTSFSFADAEDAEPTKDPDLDGWINLLEYVLVTDPLNPTHLDSRSAVLGNGNFRFTIRKDVTTNVRVESSIDLASWQAIWTSDQGSSGPGVIGYQSNDDTATITLRPNPFGLNLVPRYWRLLVSEE
jgi:cyclophilin family peptidyl-prolyl cis-trans isomerase